ncbi:hypothetical protein IV203_014603 [Nitzschia inconspicua]|uniref:Uncharacterized protein n=1 Tax=Nitzschia inconspicua TaxID=303405 RepID=A0A9K3PSR4_9STRA|nr:hypothetical protein IV203_014603 [Nitzschia inconspicua]
MEETTSLDCAVEGTVSTAGAFYGDLVSKLLSQENNSLIPLMITQSTKEITETINQPFSVSKLTDEIAARLLLIKANDDPSAAMDMSDDSTSLKQESILALVQTLAQLDKSLYLTSLAASVHKLLVVQGETNVTICAPLLQMWMQQLTHSDAVAVHTHLLQSLVVVSEFDPSIVVQGMTFLVQFWEKSLQNGNPNENSIISVRCATLWIQWMAKLGASVLDANPQALDLLQQMIQNFDDPLQQLTLMDLLVENFGSTPSSTAMVDVKVQEWLASPEMLSPILLMLQDSFLAGIALQYLSSVLVSLRPHELQLVLDFIRQRGIVSNETDRLQIVQALSNVSTTITNTALPIIMQDRVLRQAWWDISRVSQSKLQAAILTSVALALPKIEANGEAKLAMDLYNAMGPDNSTGSATLCTTQWLLEKYAPSPISELRIASYAILAAMLRLQTAGQIMALNTPKVAQAQLLECCMDPQRRESTFDARLAYFDVLETLFSLLTNKSTDGLSTTTTTTSPSASIWLATLQDEEVHKITDQLQKKIKMGPHGREPQRWDVGTE